MVDEQEVQEEVAPTPPVPEVVEPEAADQAGSLTSFSGRTIVTVRIAADGDTVVDFVRDGRQVNRFQLNRELNLEED